MNIKSWFTPTVRPARKVARVWGRNADGSRYRTALKVSELIALLNKYWPDDEVCMAIIGYEGLCAVASHLDEGSRVLGRINDPNPEAGQLWLMGRVIDPSLERGDA